MTLEDSASIGTTNLLNPAILIKNGLLATSIYGAVNLWNATNKFSFLKQINSIPINYFLAVSDNDILASGHTDNKIRILNQSLSTLTGHTGIIYHFCQMKYWQVVLEINQ